MGDFTPRVVVDAKIVAHASPRWRGAKSEVDRVDKNQQLSVGRGDAVKQLIEQKLRKALAGSDLTFNFDVTYPDETAIPDNTVVIGSSGRGQTETIVAAKGDKRSNDPNFLRADIRVRIAHELQESVPRRVLHRYEQSTRTRFWYVSVDAGVTVGAVASGSYLLVKLRNQYSQTAIGHAVVGGAGVGFTGIPKFDKFISASGSFGDETSFVTTNEVDFSVFDGIAIRHTSAKAGVFLGGELAWLTFYRLSPGAASINVSSVSLGGEFGASASTGNGVLWLDKVPPAYVIQTYPTTEFDLYKSQWLAEHKLSVFFPTGSTTTLLPTSVTELDKFLSKAAADIHGS